MAKQSSHYSVVLKDHRYWDSMAEDLLDAAQTLWEPIQAAIDNGVDDSAVAREITPLIRPYYLMAGLAVEVRLKALWVLKTGQSLGEVERLPEPLNCHDLLKLAETACVTFTEPADHNLLARLSLMVTWQGRYPLGKKPGNERITIDTHDHVILHRLIGIINQASADASDVGL